LTVKLEKFGLFPNYSLFFGFPSAWLSRRFTILNGSCF